MPQQPLLRYHQLPKWLQSNDLILTSYRAPSYSFRACTLSLAALHNETVNIHTHLWGCLVILLGALPAQQALASRHAATFSWRDAAAFGTWFVSAAGCLGLSAAHHLLSSHSPAVHACSQKLDHLGIVLMIAGSFLSMVYYGWCCEVLLAYCFCAGIVALSMACASVSCNPKSRTPAWRPYRAAMFTGLGFSAVVPIGIGIKDHGMEGMNARVALYPWLVLEVACYLVGAVLYATRMPERLSPGTFDVFGSSHQIFHVLVLCACASHFKALLATFDWNHGLGTCAARAASAALDSSGIPGDAATTWLNSSTLV